MKATKFSQFLQHREELQFVDRPHWIYVIEAGIWAIIIMFAGYWAHNWIFDNVISPETRVYGRLENLTTIIMAYTALGLKWGCLAFATFHFLNRFVFYSSTYVFASDRRLYQKTGLLHVLVVELSFDDIRRTDINYGIFGRILGYGKLDIDARFVGDVELPYTYYPEIFSKLIHYDNDLEQDINLSLATKELRKGPQRREKIEPSAKTYHNVDPMHDQMDSIDYSYPLEHLDSKEKQEKQHEADLQKELIDDFDDASEEGNEEKEGFVKPVKSSFLKT